MKFDTAAGQNPIDAQTVVGQPHPRIEGALKVTGTARYSHERQDAPTPPAYGYLVTAGFAKGRILDIDTSAAKAAPGVIAVLTRPEAGELHFPGGGTPDYLAGDRVQHYQQAIALVIAETFEQARAAAFLVQTRHDADAGRYDLAAFVQGDWAKPGAETNEMVSKHAEEIGDVDAALAGADQRIEQRYSTSHETHAMMEPHATIAAWQDGKLTVWTSSQMVNWAQKALAKIFDLTAGDVRVVSSYVGGGFGAKLAVQSDAVLAAIGARKIGRPVKLALTRAAIMNNTTHRSATQQRIRLGARRDGRLVAVSHEAISGNLAGGREENAVSQTRLLYATDNLLTSMHMAHLDLPKASDMRAPGEAPGMMALEVAMDELAHALQMDPVELRIVNDSQTVPAQPDRPFSGRHLVECLRLGAERFGWSERLSEPGQRIEGDWLIGLGVAAGYRDNVQRSSAARVHLEPGGQVTVECDMTDIGTGSYTVIAQTAAEMLGLEIEDVTVRLGDSDFPVSVGSGGQWGGNNVTAGVYAACVVLRQMICDRLNLPEPDTRFAEGHVACGATRVPLSKAAAAGRMTAEDKIDYDEDLSKRYQQATFAAHFVETAVNRWTAEVRLRRMLAVCDAGRILNPVTARSQVIGAMTMGIGSALMEELAVDTGAGFFVNHDLAGYEVPVHADVPHQEVIFLDHPDDKSSPMKAKGIGELGLCGVGAAIANAVHNATGIRVRDYPLTLDKLIDHLPQP